MYFLENDSPYDTARRFFNQQRVLCDCIMMEITEADASIKALAERSGKGCGPQTVVTTVEELPAPWDSIRSFRDYHFNCTPTKAKTKFIAIVDYLTNHDAMRRTGFNMLRAVNKVVMKAMACVGTFESKIPKFSLSQSPAEIWGSPCSSRDSMESRSSRSDKSSDNKYLRTRRFQPINVFSPLTAPTSPFDLKPDVLPGFPSGRGFQPISHDSSQMDWLNDFDTITAEVCSNEVLSGHAQDLGLPPCESSCDSIWSTTFDEDQMDFEEFPSPMSHESLPASSTITPESDDLTDWEDFVNDFGHEDDSSILSCNQASSIPMQSDDTQLSSPILPALSKYPLPHIYSSPWLMPSTSSIPQNRMSYNQQFLAPTSMHDQFFTLNRPMSFY